MVNEQRQRGVPDWQRRAWLTEYEACQHDISSSATHYWAIAAIFIGICAALLAGIVFGIFSNNTLLNSFIKNDDPHKVTLICGIALVVSTVVIIILKKVRKWLNRITFLQQINYIRMREIELKLKMWKSWRVHTIDAWMRIRGDKKLRNVEWDELKEELTKEIIDSEDSNLLEGKKDKIVDICKRYTPEKKDENNSGYPNYARPGRNNYYEWILYSIISLCGIVVLCALFAIIRAWL